MDKVWDSKKVLDFVGQLRPQLELTTEGLSFGIEAQGDQYKKTLNIAFQFLEETIKRTKEDVVVLFDEFQAIREVKNGDAILKYMRGKIQKSLLVQLAGIGPQENVKLFGRDFQKAIRVKSPGAVTNALSALEKKEYIYKSDKHYHFANPFFKEWVLNYRYFIKAIAGTLKAGTPLSGTRLDFGYRERLMQKIK